VKPVLREKWLDYYQLNHHWIETAKIHQGQGWNENIDGQDISFYCPDSKFMIGVITALDKAANGFINISTQLTGGCHFDRVVENFGLKIDPSVVLKNREKSISQISEAQEIDVSMSEVNTDLLTIFNQVKSELRKKWINYYIANHDWIKLTELYKGHRWNEVVEEKTVTLYCPHSFLLVGVASGLDKRVAGLIYISTQLTGTCNLDRIAKGLGLVFDIESVLEERRRIIKERSRDTN
jgi:hypothetical protein